MLGFWQPCAAYNVVSLTNPNLPPSLERLAAFFGIDPAYQTVWGHIQVATPAVLRSTLAAISANQIPEEAYSDESAAESWLAARRASRWLDRHLIAEDVDRPLESLRFRDGRRPDPGALIVEIDWEDGSQSRFTPVIGEDGAVTVPPGSFGKAVPGYHHLTLRAGERHETYTWILSPSRTFQEGPARAAGLSCFLPALRSSRNWGCGDFRDLVELAKTLPHFDFLALNPLHALANRAPYNVSPYSPVSLLRLNFIYAVIEELPEFPATKLAQKLLANASTQALLTELRSGEAVHYEAVARLKFFFLKLLYRQFARQGSVDFERWKSTREPWLSQFCTYSAVWDWLHRRNPHLWVWQDWPPELQNPHSDAVAALALSLRRQIDFYAWVQWRLEQQLDRAHAEITALGFPLGLYGDLAVASDKTGSDRWANPSLYSLGLRIGSPPDDFNESGQDWGFPALRPVEHCPEVIAYFRESLRALARHTRLIRLDHVMRLARLYTIPDGVSAREGIYVRDHFEALLRILAIESHRSRTLIVGEDLGTVPDYFRSALDSFGILSYRLVMFEWDNSHRKPAQSYPPSALCAFTTHDLPTFDAYLSGADLDVRVSLGRLDHAALASAREQRYQDLLSLAKVFGSQTMPNTPDEMFHQLIHFLVETPSRLLLVSLEDLTGEIQQINLPGTTSEYPNWRRKSALSIEDLGHNPTVAARLEAWRSARLRLKD